MHLSRKPWHVYYVFYDFCLEADNCNNLVKSSSRLSTKEMQRSMKAREKDLRIEKYFLSGNDS